MADPADFAAAVAAAVGRVIKDRTTVGLCTSRDEAILYQARTGLEAIWMDIPEPMPVTGLQLLNYQIAALADAPTHFLPLDEPAGAAAARNLGSAGTHWAASGVTFGTKVGNSTGAELTVASSAITAPGPLLAGATSWTVEAVIRYVNTDNVRMTLIGPSRPSWRIGRGLPRASRLFTYHGGTYYSQSQPDDQTVGTFYHHVSTYDGSRIRSYRNGIELNSFAVTGPTVEPAIPAIGKNDADPGWGGTVAGFAVYVGKALTAGQVAAHATALNIGAA